MADWADVAPGLKVADRHKNLRAALGRSVFLTYGAHVLHGSGLPFVASVLSPDER